MDQNNKWLNLQLFAGEGTGDGGGEGAATGESAVDAGQQRLRELGVPEDKLRKRAQRSAPKLPAGAVRTAQTQEAPKQTTEQAAAADNPTEVKTDKPARMSWDEIMADPEYNKQMQATVQGRLRGAKAAEEAMGKLAPALELLARRHGQDPAKMDYEALAKAISDDDSFYEDKALEMGVSVETAKQIDQQERENARQKRQEQMTLEQQRIQQHLSGLEQQAEELKKTFPGFDLRNELKNPTFARLTSPNSGLSLADAYFAIHRQEIMAASAQVAAQQTAIKTANAIRSGSLRPQENGSSGQAPSVSAFDPKAMSPAQRADLKRRIMAGEKIYPGQL